MKRRTFLRGFVAATTGTAGGLPLADQLRAATSAVGAPCIVYTDDVDELEQAALTLTSRDLRGGGHGVIAEGQSLLNWGTSLLKQADSQQLRKRIASATGYLADRTGWTAFDLGFHDRASKLFGLGIRLATEADDRNLTAQILCDMAGHAVFRNKPAEALDCAELALSDPAVAQQLRAAIYGVSAEAYGQLGDLGETMRYIDLAYEHTDETPPGDGPAWLPAFRGPQTLAASTGYAAFLTYQQGRHPSASTVASQHLSIADQSLGSTRGRSATLCRLRRASITCSATDADEGLALALRATQDLHLVRSTRIRRELRTLKSALPLNSRHSDRTIERIDLLLAGQVIAQA